MEPFRRKAPGDPNARKNRVPGKTEMKTLRILAQRNDRLMQDLDGRIEEGKNTCVELRRRYQELLETVEGMESELVAAERTVTTLETQKSLIKEDQGKLMGLMHPIRGCPSDLLQYIFEWAVEMDQSRFVCATYISHVCHRWRDIALQTPKLWTEIEVSSFSWPEDVKMFWSRTVERVKAAAANVIITIAATMNEDLMVIRECRLDLLLNINHLEFRLATRQTAEPIVSASLQLPARLINNLKLDVAWDSSTSIEATAILPRFSMIRSLEITNFNILTFSQNLQIPNVTRLYLRNVIMSSLHPIVRNFPNLDILTLSHVTFLPSDFGGISWPKLRQLNVMWCQHLSLGNVIAARLTHLLFWGEVNEGIIAFIASHTSLEVLNTSYTQDLVSAIATSAPQLRSFTIDACEELADPRRMKFNKLTHLGIYDFEAHPLSLDLFERIVKARFLSKSGNDTTTEAEPPLLEILIEDEPLENLRWLHSELIASARQEVATMERWDKTWTTYRYKWA